MGKQINSIKGMNDILPHDMALFNCLLDVVRKSLSGYGYEEISTPILEKTDLFARSIGGATDIVSKEMYTFLDKSDESLTLRPEATAGIVRAGITNNLFYGAQKKLWCYGPMFRYERPQKGRFRQFHQVSVETFGYSNIGIDAELIAISNLIWDRLKIDKPTLEINTMGSFESREAYKSVLVDYFKKFKKDFDQDDKRRIELNPLRLLDTKNIKLKKAIDEAPSMFEYIDDESKNEFIELLALLDRLGIKYQLNNKLVRGLDYYNKTVFEWTTDKLGSQSAICSGGRYDSLVGQLGGADVPACGWALGMERIIELMKLSSHVNENNCDVYVIPVGKDALSFTINLMDKMNRELKDIIIFADYADTGLKSRMKKADKSGAKYAVIVGEDELKQSQVSLKDMRDSSEQKSVSTAGLLKLLKKEKNNG